MDEEATLDLAADDDTPEDDEDVLAAKPKGASVTDGTSNT